MNNIQKVGCTSEVSVDIDYNNKHKLSLRLQKASTLRVGAIGVDPLKADPIEEVASEFFKSTFSLLFITSKLSQKDERTQIIDAAEDAASALYLHAFSDEMMITFRKDFSEEVFEISNYEYLDLVDVAYAF